MCGIFGYSFAEGSVSEGRRAILAYMLADANDTRGGHSWGFTAINGTELTVKRGLGKLKYSAFRLGPTNALFAHTRWATHGAKSVENAHPFEIEHIVGAHNGVLDNHYELCEKYKRKFDVDSMHLFAHLAHGLPFDEIRGYGSIEWIDKANPSEINLCRMYGGELAIYGIGKDPESTTGIVWSSDEDHAHDALQAAGLLKQSFRFRVEETRVYSVIGGRMWYKSGLTIELGKRTGRAFRWSDYKDDAFGNLKAADGGAKKTKSLDEIDSEWLKDYYSRRDPWYADEDEDDLEYFRRGR